MNLTLDDFERMVESGAPFAHKIGSDAVLNKIDRVLLRRSASQFTPGGWCMASYGRKQEDSCLVYASSDVTKPSSSSKRLEMLVTHLLDNDQFRGKQCK